MVSWWKIAKYLVPAVLLAGSYAATFHFAYQRGQDVEKRQQLEELARIHRQQVNQAKELASVTSKYIATRNENQSLKDELDDLARKDPHADRPALGSDSVQRLNQIQ